jgi:hypothetical protein
MNHAENTAFVVKETCLLIRYLAMDVLLLHAFAYAGICIPSRCLALRLYVTILSSTDIEVRATWNSQAYVENNIKTVIKYIGYDVGKVQTRDFEKLFYKRRLLASQKYYDAWT